MILRFLSEDEQHSVDCKGLNYGQILVLQARILSDDHWKWQVLPEKEEEAVLIREE